MSDLDELEPRTTRKARKRKGVRLDHSSPEAAQESSERFYGQYSPEELEARVMPAPATWWYVPGTTKEGKSVFLGPFATSQTADQELAHLDDGELFESKSRNLAKATQEYKAELIRRGKAPDRALKKLGHKR